jgi:type II secretory pathway pseudopilin PulG
MTLVELLVVLAIVAAISGAVTFAISRTVQEQQEKECLTNMLMVEAAKDEYARDHVGQPMDQAEFRKYFRFKIPTCPANSNEPYQNLFDLNAPVACRIHPRNSQARGGNP